MANSPLLLKGYNTQPDGTANQLPVITAARGSINGTFDNGRGNVVAIDLLTVAEVAGGGSGNGNAYPNDMLVIDLLIGGVQVLTQVSAAQFVATADPGTNWTKTPLTQPGGQTWQINWQDVGALTQYGFQMLAYYENIYDVPAVRNAIFTSRLKRRFQDFTNRFATNIKLATSGRNTIPTSQGNVVGLQLLCTPCINNGVEAGTATIAVDGVTIFQNVSLGFFQYNSAREQIFPCVINGGSTFTITYESNSVAAAEFVYVGLRLYFDDQTENVYKSICQ